MIWILEIGVWLLIIYIGLLVGSLTYHILDWNLPPAKGPGW